MTLIELEACFQLLLEMLRSRGVESVETGQHDLYWSILSEDWLNFQNEPEPAVGSLDDDLRELKRVASGESIASLVDLERIGAVLKLLADDLSRAQ